MESLRLAVACGADEVYLGVNDFNARNNIDGFTLDNLAQAIDYAHVFGVKVNLALNILFADNELPQALDVARQAANMGIDALIVQDLGLAHLIHTHYPAVPLHASTQMGIHNLAGVQAILPYGFCRVILARETPLDEVRRIKDNTDIEIEYFAQGALCVCFSGNCYLSERLCDASGNRGRCKQLCRLPYTFGKDGVELNKGFLLSAKDFNLIDRLGKLKQAGVDVIKIEGRARRPSYVAAATQAYRNALDGKPYDKESLCLAFNRLYTPAYMDGNGDIISPYNNHIGIAVGQVQQVTYGNKFNEVYFTSSRPLAPKSVLKLFDKNKEVNTLSAYDLVEVKPGLYRTTTTQMVAKGVYVHLISDPSVEEKAASLRPQRPLAVRIEAQVGQPIAAYCEGVSAQGAVCLAAQNQPLDAKQLQENFAKSEVFAATVTLTTEDKVFLPKKDLNALRRDLFESVYTALTAPYKRDLPSICFADDDPTIEREVCLVEEQKDPITGPIAVYSPSCYTQEDVQAFVFRCRQAGAEPYLDLPNFALTADIAHLQDIVCKTGVGVVANNYYALTFAAPILVGHGLNVYNRHTARVLGRPVLARTTAKGILSPYMTLRHCPMQANLGADCYRCPYQDGYYYVMDNGKILRLKRKKLSTCTFYLV